MTTQKNSRSRVFATIIYPESTAKDWIQKLKDMHIQAFISPLHDKDLNPDGELKKPHYHVMLMFDSPKNFENQIKPIFEKIGGVGRENVNSARGYARYLCHLDNPEKAQYNVNNIQALGGADYRKITLLPSDTTQILKDIFRYINENNIRYLAQFIDICADEHEDWFELITTQKAYIIDKYIKSRTYMDETQTNVGEDQVKRILDILKPEVKDEKKEDIEKLLRAIMK